MKMRRIASFLSSETNKTILGRRQALLTRRVCTLRGAIRLSTSTLPVSPSSLLPYSTQKIRTLSSSTKSTSGEVDFLLADIGEGIAEVELLKWMVKPGDRIAQFDPICEVQSDKANVEITSRYDGVVKTLHSKVGAMVKVGHPLLTVTLDSSSDQPTPTPSSKGSPASPSLTPSSSSSSTPSSSDVNTKNEKVLASPAVRALAKEHKLDLSTIKATGKDGRITKEDVLNFLDGTTKQITPTPIPTTPTPTIPAPIKQIEKSPTPVKGGTPSPSPLAVLAQDKVVPIGGLQRIMVQTMVASNAVPQFGYSDELLMDELVKVRNQVKSIAEKSGVRLSYLAFIIKAVSLALVQYPQLNAWVKDANCTEMIYKASHNIGLAMDTPRGLLVPNIKNVQEKSVLDIGRELNRLSELGSQSKLGKEDLTGGTFTLSNIGSIGGTYTKPIILLPEVVIGGLGKFQTLPRYDSKNNLYPATIMAITWSADHRVLDGATVARFSNVLKQYIENPSSLIINLK